MLDIKFIRENPEIIKNAAKKKHIDFNIDDLLNIDKKRIDLSQKIDELRAQQNQVSIEIPKVPLEEKQQKIEEMGLVKERLKFLEKDLDLIMLDWKKLMLQVPNIPDISVPEGESELDNQELKTWGEKTKFDFEPKDHIQIMQDLNMVNFERGSKTHGFRGYYLIGDGVKLCFAIWNYALKFFTERGFNPVMPPMIVRKDLLYGTGHLPGDNEDYYLTQDNDALIGTAEVPLMGYYRDEILDLKDLPVRFLGFSACFRREAGSYSKDVKGLIRVHEFYKFEQFILCEASHEESVKYHEELHKNIEDFIESLNIPYQTVINSGGDLGQGQVKKYDINLWVPKEEKYREIGSTSYFHDFQARRSNVKYKDRNGKTNYVHSLNATAIPTPRILVSLIENCQNQDGSINIPEALRPFLENREVIFKK